MGWGPCEDRVAAHHHPAHALVARSQRPHETHQYSPDIQTRKESMSLKAGKQPTLPPSDSASAVSAISRRRLVSYTLGADQATEREALYTEGSARAAASADASAVVCVAGVGGSEGRQDG